MLDSKVIADARQRLKKSMGKKVNVVVDDLLAVKLASRTTGEEIPQNYRVIVHLPQFKQEAGEAVGNLSRAEKIKRMREWSDKIQEPVIQQIEQGGVE